MSIVAGASIQILMHIVSVGHVISSSAGGTKYSDLTIDVLLHHIGYTPPRLELLSGLHHVLTLTNIFL